MNYHCLLIRGSFITSSINSTYFKPLGILTKMKDYYKILGVVKTDSIDTIKKAYRKLALVNHPDKGGNKERFSEISEAHEILGNPEKRHQYDNGGMGNILYNLFRKSRTTKRKTVIHPIPISLHQVYTGATKHINVNLIKRCFACRQTCTDCGGSGNKNMQTMMGFISMIQQIICKTCQGTGMLVALNPNCGRCKGQGQFSEKCICPITIPVGIVNGAQTIFSGMGEQPMTPNELPGDLIFRIKILPDPHFTRRGNDLVHKVEISFIESVVGKTITVPLFSGEEEVDLSQFCVIDPRKEYTISGKGMNGGNLVLVFDVKYSLVTDEQRTRLKEVL